MERRGPTFALPRMPAILEKLFFRSCRGRTLFLFRSCEGRGTGPAHVPRCSPPLPSVARSSQRGRGPPQTVGGSLARGPFRAIRPAPQTLRLGPPQRASLSDREVNLGLPKSLERLTHAIVTGGSPIRRRVFPVGTPVPQLCRWQARRCSTENDKLQEQNSPNVSS